MAKFYKRGEPVTPELQQQVEAIRREYDLDHNRITLETEFPNHTLHDLENGEVELAAEDGSLYRLYLVRSAVDHVNLVVDDYHPEEDADVKVNAYGELLSEYPEDQT